MNSFICKNCRKVVSNIALGTSYRNHCPYCLWSLHLDKKTPGDRLDLCEGLMEPIGLTFKNEGFDKYGQLRQGELMLVHFCKKCGKISLNRLAGDDDPFEVLTVFQKSIRGSIKFNFATKKIKLLGKEAQKEVTQQLFGK